MPDYRNENPPVHMSDAEVALAAGAAIGKPQAPLWQQAEAGNASYAVIPKGYELKSLEEFLACPLRVREEVALQDTDSFVAYVNAFKVPETTRILFDIDTERFAAVLDYHEAADGDVLHPSWCDHVATFMPRKSEEWKAWIASNRKEMAQVQFARFIEDNMPDVKEPNSAEFLQIALTFEAKKSVEFSSGVRLASGQIQFQYDEIVRGAAQKGTMEVPEHFVLGIPIHTNGPAYRIPVRLHWRLDGSKLLFWYEVVRPHKYLEDALSAIQQRVTTDTGISVLAGSRGK